MDRTGGGRPRRTTIHDVARAAGVSHQTVSNVVHGTGRVGDRTRDRVREAIAALGYRPHAGAASLRTSRSRRLAHPITTGELQVGNAIMLEFVAALAEAAGRAGHHLLLTTSGDGGLDDIAQLAGSGAIDAVVLADVANHDPRVQALTSWHIPFACFGRTAADLPQNWVDVDNHAGLAAATGHMLERGHRAVAFLGYTAQGRWDVEREAGYRDTMTAAGLEPVVVTADLSTTATREAVAGLLDRGARPTAVVTGSDVLAAAVYAAASRRGLRIGSDLAVSGFDGSVAGRALDPMLTTVRIPVQRLTELLVSRVLDEVDGPTGRPGEVLVPDLVVGASS
ncbi:LacI family DNA-binding transcriptional regulator [Jatrophihabitans endophyticus]|uniref:LacI family DNA-binding transcriptional regulator n=1 Tax=Jatrophihabitans endophyticus TaxID=1206085 RepID=UPI0019D8FCB3|nr:LacI family DNA-binding transcriptional regulator [Jatrophihabitans endophyticus]MBE7188360.1 LacI family DNA-binding transcriptional regulator [Jatrophihabitans endophyticus]